MPRLFLHIRADDGWRDAAMDAAQVPAMGEHVTLADSNGYYRVVTVVHCLFAGSQYDAELHLEQVPASETSRILRQP